MTQVPLRISILNNSRLDSVCGAIGRHDCEGTKVKAKARGKKRRSPRKCEVTL